MNNFIRLSIFACLFFTYSEFQAQTPVSVEESDTTVIENVADTVAIQNIDSLGNIIDSTAVAIVDSIIERVDTVYCSLFFSQNNYSVDIEEGSNTKMITYIADTLFRYCKYWNLPYFADIIAYSTLDEADTTFLSSDSTVAQLPDLRALYVKNYLKLTAPFYEPEEKYFSIESGNEDWEGLRNYALTDDTIPNQQQLIDILASDSLDNEGKRSAIEQLDDGTTYSYLKEKVLPHLRRADVRFKVTYRETLNHEILRGNAVDTTAEVQPEIPSEIPAAAPRVRWAVKTNLLYWVSALIINAGVEYPVGKQLTINVPFTFSPYTLSTAWRIRTLSVQPEIRYWLDQPMAGHFFGFHTHFAYYNISTDKLDRYQDKGGKSPLWGFGLNYGYAFHLKKNWNMEAAIGLGYARLNYDVFYNVGNGARYESHLNNYWGITQAAVNLIYMFNE